MPDDALVTVVIATRDRPDFLRAAVAAVGAQSLEAVIETIVVFDQCSIVPEVASDDPRRPVRTLSNTRSPGLAGARNTGVLAARGAYVAFCDDDDLWLPEKLAIQLESLRQAPGASMVTCGISIEYEGRRHDRALKRKVIHLADLVRDRHAELHPSTFLFRTGTLRDEIGLVNESVPGGFGEDYELLLRAARYAPISNVEVPLVVVRWHPSSFFFRRWQTMAAGLNWLLDHYGEFAEDGRGFARVKAQVAFAEAAMGNRRESLASSWSAWRRHPLEPRIPLALLVNAGLVRSGTVMQGLHRVGRGL